MYVVKIYSSWHFALLREQGRLRNKPKLFQVKIDEVTPTKLANKISLGHFAVGNKFTGLRLTNRVSVPGIFGGSRNGRKIASPAKNVIFDMWVWKECC